MPFRSKYKKTEKNRLQGNIIFCQVAEIPSDASKGSQHSLSQASSHENPWERAGGRTSHAFGAEVPPRTANPPSQISPAKRQRVGPSLVLGRRSQSAIGTNWDKHFCSAQSQAKEGLGILLCHILSALTREGHTDAWRGLFF